MLVFFAHRDLIDVRSVHEVFLDLMFQIPEYLRFMKIIMLVTHINL